MRRTHLCTLILLRFLRVLHFVLLILVLLVVLFTLALAIVVALLLVVVILVVVFVVIFVVVGVVRRLLLLLSLCSAVARPSVRGVGMCGGWMCVRWLCAAIGWCALLCTPQLKVDRRDASQHGSVVRLITEDCAATRPRTS